MKTLKTHLKAQPPKLSSFTECGLWIYEIGDKRREKKITRIKKEVTCERCKNSKAYKTL